MSISVLLRQVPAVDEIIVTLDDGELVSVRFAERVTAGKLNKVARSIFQMASLLTKARYGYKQDRIARE